MIIVPFSTLRWLSCSILVWEHHVAWAHSSVHEITGNLVERTWHLLIILHDWTTLELTFHALVWLTLSCLFVTLVYAFHKSFARGRKMYLMVTVITVIIVITMIYAQVWKEQRLA